MFPNKINLLFMYTTIVNHFIKSVKTFIRFPVRIVVFSLFGIKSRGQESNEKTL